MLVSINLVVYNGEKYIKECLNSVFNQTYSNIEILVFDNNSKDDTLKIVRALSKKSKFPIKIIENEKNHGFSVAQNKVFQLSKGEYVLALCVDIVLDKNFVKESVKMFNNKEIGAIQSKTYCADWSSKEFQKTNIIDTTGFLIFKSRRLVNRGHGQIDNGQYNNSEEIFSQEGACPIFRRKAIESVMINNQFLDEDIFWYATDIDLGWRMRLAGWKAYFNPKVIAYHDRPTTKRLSKGNLDFIKLRKTVPVKRKRLDYRNWRLVILKNSFYSNLLKDIFPFLFRELKLFIYILFFETGTLKVIPDFFKLLPKILRKRKLINRKISKKEIRKWFI